MLKTPDLLIFLHMGKTGGVTFGSILSRNFAQDQQFDGNQGETRSALGLRNASDIAAAYGQLDIDRRRRVRLIYGHVPMGIHTLVERPARYVTLLRHPVDRVISSLYYIRQRHEIPIQPLIREMSLDAYLDSHLGLDPYDYQVRVLSSVPELNAEWTDGRPIHAARVSRAHLTRAKRNVKDHFLFAGTLERLDEALVLLRWTFGWAFEDLLLAPQNVTPSRPSLRDVSVTTMSKLRALNTFDLELYSWVDARFRRLCRSL